jgi:predicted nucleic acid-binding protein
MTPDTSVVIAGLSSWHPDHELARPVLAASPPILAHVLGESYSVLTRLPAPRRLDPTLAITALRRAFPDAAVTLAGRRLAPLLERLAGSGIRGGATYDAIVAETARVAGLTLITFDARARATYATVGVEVHWLE